MSKVLLDLKHVDVTVNQGTVDENKILKDVDLRINEGDFICLVGGNGAGKSTLLNTLAGELTPSSGELDYKGKNINKSGEEERSKFIGRVFQDPKIGTAPRMTVAENLLLALKRGEKRHLLPRKLKNNREKFAQALKQVNPELVDKMNSFVDQLSGGQRQALSFVMATIKRPELLLLDEHTAALDPRSSRNLLEATNNKIKADKITAIMITHRMEDAIKYGNRLIIMDHGQILHDYNSEEKAKLTQADLIEYFD